MFSASLPVRVGKFFFPGLEKWKELIIFAADYSNDMDIVIGIVIIVVGAVLHYFTRKYGHP